MHTFHSGQGRVTVHSQKDFRREKNAKGAWNWGWGWGWLVGRRCSRKSKCTWVYLHVCRAGMGLCVLRMHCQARDSYHRLPSLPSTPHHVTLQGPSTIAQLAPSAPRGRLLPQSQHATAGPQGSIKNSSVMLRSPKEIPPLPQGRNRSPLSRSSICKSTHPVQGVDCKARAVSRTAY